MRRRTQAKLMRASDGVARALPASRAAISRAAPLEGSSGLQSGRAGEWTPAPPAGHAAGSSADGGHAGSRAAAGRCHSGPSPLRA